MGVLQIWGIQGGLPRVKRTWPMMAQWEQTGPKTPSPAAVQCPAPARGYTSQHISTDLPHALVTAVFKSSKLRSNLFSFHSAIHLQHMVFEIKAWHCYTKRFKLLSSPPYQRLGEHSHKLSPRLPGTCTTAPSRENPLLGLIKPLLWLNSAFSLMPLTQQAGDLLAFVKCTRTTLRHVWRNCPRPNAHTAAKALDEMLTPGATDRWEGSSLYSH